MLTETQTARLERLKHYGTRWEIVAEHPDGRRVLILYSARRSVRGLVDALRQIGAKHIDAFRRTFGSAEGFTPAAKAAQGGTVGEWRVRFSGRTQREAITGGELPWIAD